MHKSNIQEKFSQIQGHWQPGAIARINNYELRIAKIKGEFEWHHHAETDEMFIVNKGQFDLHLRDQIITLHEGDIFVVPKGVEHKPVAEKECEIMMFEPTGTLNTGETVSERTVNVQDI